VKYWRVIIIGISTLLLWAWVSPPIVSMASTADSPATIRFAGQSESSTQSASDDQLHVTETSKSSHSEPKNNQSSPHQTHGWLPQTNEQWWLSAFIGGIGLLVILISWQLITYLKKRSSLL